MTDDLAVLDATAQAALVRDGKASPRELVDAALARIDAVNPQLNAVIHRRDERARAEADAGPPDGPFRGVPILVKDLDGSLAGEPLHLGNRMLRDLGHVADHDSYLFARLRAAGCVIVGKTNTPELGLLPTTESHAYAPARNPWDLTRSPGGSSGGSAAAVASGMVPGRPRGRRRRLDPHPGQRVRAVRPQADAWVASRSVPTTARRGPASSRATS